jgi:hypothetical protein
MPVQPLKAISMIIVISVLVLVTPNLSYAAIVANSSKENLLLREEPSSAVSSSFSSPTDNTLPDAPQPQSAVPPQVSSNLPGQNSTSGSLKQTKRILFIVPNFRSVSADAKLPPMSVKDKFKLVLDDTFDYSGFIEVGILAGVSDIHKSEPAFGHGTVAYGRYYWHGLADTTDGNLMTEFLVPVATREDPRYYTLGHGGFAKRTVYSVSRLLITRSDSGRATPNFSEIVGNGAASGISNLYYPGTDRTWTKTGQRWVLQVGIDGLANLAKEFWPDINDKFFHDKY